MVGNSLEQEIIGLYNAELTASYSINEIAKRLNKTYPYIYKKVSMLISQGILKKVVIGRSYLCSINFSNDTAILLLSLNEVSKKKRLLRNNPRISALLQHLETKKKQYKLQSVVKVKDRLLIISSLKSLGARLSPRPIMLNENSFQEYLVQHKEATSDHVVLYSCEKYFECVKEVEGKLRLKNSRIL